MKVHANAYTGSGVPDVVCCLQGIFIAFEAKHPRYKNAYRQLREEQKVHLIQISEAGGLAFAVSSLDQVKLIVDEVTKALGEK